MEKYRITFDSIEEARAAFCNKMCGGECVDTCPMQEHLKATGESCMEFVQNHPFIASLTMNADVVHTKESATDINAPCKTYKPPLAEILGVEVGKHFKLPLRTYENSEFYIGASGYMYKGKKIASSDTILFVINKPKQIIRIPKLTEQEIMICKFLGAKWLTRNKEVLDSSIPVITIWTRKPSRRRNGEYACSISHCDNGCIDTGRIAVFFNDKAFPSVKQDSCINVEEQMR